MNHGVALFLALILSIIHTSPLQGAEITIGDTVLPSTGVVRIERSEGCATTVVVQRASAFRIGDRVMVYQAKGLRIDTTKGTCIVSSVNNAGHFELGTVASIRDSSVLLKAPLIQPFDAAAVVQLVKVLSGGHLTITGTVTSQWFDGACGGVVMVETDTLNLRGSIDVSGKGFRGGAISAPSANCLPTIPYTSRSAKVSGDRGEGLVITNVHNESGSAYLADAGGGGGGVCAGGGGGGFFAGDGGFKMEYCPEPRNGGQGGRIGPSMIPEMYPSRDMHCWLGAGGGGGHQGSSGATRGANGGGAVIVRCGTFTTRGGTIYAKGESAGKAQDGGGGGGGGGGSVYLHIPAVFSDTLFVDITGGRGGNIEYAIAHGPGGGGSGGSLFVADTATFGRSTIVSAPLVANHGVDLLAQVMYPNRPWTHSYGATTGYGWFDHRYLAANGGEGNCTFPREGLPVAVTYEMRNDGKKRTYEMLPGVSKRDTIVFTNIRHTAITATAVQSATGKARIVRTLPALPYKMWNHDELRVVVELSTTDTVFVADTIVVNTDINCLPPTRSELNWRAYTEPCEYIRFVTDTAIALGVQPYGTFVEREITVINQGESVSITNISCTGPILLQNLTPANTVIPAGASFRARFRVNFSTPCDDTARVWLRVLTACGEHLLTTFTWHAVQTEGAGACDSVSTGVATHQAPQSMRYTRDDAGILASCSAENVGGHMQIFNMLGSIVYEAGIASETTAIRLKPGTYAAVYTLHGITGMAIVLVE